MAITRFGASMAARRAARRREGLADSIAASGAAGGYGIDPVDGDVGYRGIGIGRRDIPAWTAEKARIYSVHAYRTNPMARAIVDTVTSFAVGDTGVRLEVQDPEVRVVAERFWRDPRNRVANVQDILLRSHLLNGETCLELMVGPTTGVARFSYIDPAAICRVVPYLGNPLWPGTVVVNIAGEERPYAVAAIDDLTGLRVGEVLWQADWRAVATDTRGFPYLGPDLDWLEAYDRVLYNLVDRTALARYMVWDVEVAGDQDDVDRFLAQRGSLDPPRSGSIEVHNAGVKWEPKMAQAGAFEDRATAQQLLTSVAAGAGLSKVWLAEPEDANRATSITMAEPVRRRIGGIQRNWTGYVTELVRFAVDQAIAAGRLERMVTLDREGTAVELEASETVEVMGPEIAAADAQVNANILLNLSTGLAGMISAGVLSPEAAKLAGRKAWEDYMGIPYRPDLDQGEDTDPDELADYVDDQGPAPETWRPRLPRIA